MLQHLKIWLVGFFGSLFLRLVRASIKLEIVDPFETLKFAIHKPIVGAFWHGHQMMMPWLYIQGLPRAKRLPAHVLSSKSQDGRFMAKVLSFFGLKTVAGSSSSGGAEALLQLNRAMKNENSHVIFTPDGPRGPIYKVKSGTVTLASNTGAPLVPISFACTSFWTFNSWDKMMLPKPFSKAVIYLGQPMSVPEGLSDEQIVEWQSNLEVALNKTLEQAQGSLLIIRK